MNATHFDSELSDDDRRSRLYDGDLFVYSPRDSSNALIDFTKKMIEDAFAPLDPELAHQEMPVERYAEILSELKPAFIHHPESKRLIADLLVDFACEEDQTYFDVPRLRSSTPGGYLTTGIAYAFHPHRDSWYSAPQCQLNWWLPVYGITRDNGLAFHPAHWDQPIANSSHVYNYAEWNRTSRFGAAKHIGKDTRVQPKPTGPVLPPETRPLCSSAGMIVFAGAQLHSSVTNTSDRTRFSVDFRTVHEAEVDAGTGAPNIDSVCTGTTMGDYLRISDLAHLPDDTIARYDEGFGRPACGKP